jgi:hypothetical protein
MADSAVSHEVFLSSLPNSLADRKHSVGATNLYHKQTLSCIFAFILNEKKEKKDLYLILDIRNSRPPRR